MKMSKHETFGTFLKELNSALRSLPHTLQLAFATSCCERAFPNYVAFARQEGWEDPSVLRVCLDRVWDFVEGSTFPEAEARDLENKCSVLTPDSDDFPSTEATAAQEAALMVTLLLRFCYDKTPDYAVRIATFARDTIDMFVDPREGLVRPDPSIERRISNHPLMIAELKTQKEDLLRLQDKTSGALREFRKHACGIRQSNIGIPVSS